LKRLSRRFSRTAVGRQIDHPSTVLVALSEHSVEGFFRKMEFLWEWCGEWYGDFASSAQTDPMGPGAGSNRVNRRGSWDAVAGGLRGKHAFLSRKAGPANKYPGVSTRANGMRTMIEGDHDMKAYYTAKYNRIPSGYLGQIVEWPEIVTEGETLEDCRLMLKDALEEMLKAAEQIGMEPPVSGVLFETISMDA
jgi:predicted RNase H-like HicB family nuclease